MHSGSDWSDDFRESVSRVNEQYGIDESAGVSLFFKVFAGLNPIKWFTAARNLFKGDILAVPISGRGTWAINQTRRLLSFFIPFAGITAALVSAAIEYNMLTKLYDSTPMELSEITYKLPEKIFFRGLHTLGFLDIRKQSDSEQQDSHPPDNKELPNDQQGDEQQNSEQQNTSEGGKSWVPLMIVFAFETAKCYLIFYRSAKRHQDLSEFKRVMTLVTSLGLIIISGVCTLVFFVASMSQQQLDEASKEKGVEMGDNYEERKAQIEANEAKRLASFKAEIEELERDHRRLLDDKDAEIQRNLEALENKKDKRDEYIDSVEKQLMQLITDERSEINASQDRRAEIEESYRKRKAQIEANEAKRLASFKAEIEELERERQQLLDGKDAEIQRNLEALENKKGKRDEYIDSVEKKLEEDLKTTQKDKSNIKTSIAKSSAADPEWMKKVLDAVKIFRDNADDNADDEDYPRAWAYVCIGLISLSVTAALELIIWCVFAIIGEESST